MGFSVLTSFLLNLAIAGTLAREVEAGLLMAEASATAVPETTEVEINAAVDRKQDERTLLATLERLEQRSRRIQSLQVQFKRMHISRMWDDTVDCGEGRLVLEKGKFGVLESVRSSKAADAAPIHDICIWNSSSVSLINATNRSGFIIPREGKDHSWMPSDLKLPFFFDTNVAEMTKEYQFALTKATQRTYTLRVTRREPRNGGYFVTAVIVLDRETLNPTALSLDNGNGEYDVYRALDSKFNRPIPEDIRRVVEGSACDGYKFETIGAKHWMRRWVQFD